MGRRGVAAATVVLLTLPVAGCVGPRARSDPAVDRARPAPGGLGWRRVAIDGPVRAVLGGNSAKPPPHLLATGLRAGRPFVVDVTNGVARSVPVERAGFDGAGADRIESDGQNIAVAGDGDPARGRPATVWFGDEYGIEPGDAPRDEQQRRPIWLWPLMDGEGDYRMVGAVFAAGRWRVRAWSAEPDWQQLDPDPLLQLPAAASPGDLLAGSTEGQVVVAGAVANEPVPPGAKPQVWSIYAYPDPGAVRRWQRWELSPTPDRLTDIVSWPVGWWVAGHRALRPVVYDFDSADGASLPVPDTRLDPDHPAVYLADVPVGEPMVLATQSVDGPTVWIARSGPGWTRVPAPRGRLAAAHHVGDGIYLLINGTVWYRRLAGLTDAAS